MITLETIDVYRIQLEFPDRCIPTCHKCGGHMNTIYIMSDCLFTQKEEKLNRKKNNESLDIRGYDQEGQKSHVHFEHKHPNSESIEPARYCPFTNTKW